MPGLSRRLKQFDEELLAFGEETLLEELIAGLLACPELIGPNDWLPIVWKGTAQISCQSSKASTISTEFALSSWSLSVVVLAL
jgi:hypothetical protein